MLRLLNTWTALILLSLLFSWEGGVCAVSLQEKSLVVFFGGYKSTPSQMENWVHASSRSNFAGRFSFMAIAYPAEASGDGRAAAGYLKSEIDSLIQIFRENPNRKVILACHSSGCGIANVLAEEIFKNKQTSINLTMINLDGGKSGGCLPSEEIFSRIPTYCWTVESRDGKIKSFNFEDAKNFCPNKQVRVYTADGCRTQMCLHFSIVNSTLRDKWFQRKVDYFKLAYDRIMPNLYWLNTLQH